MGSVGEELLSWQSQLKVTNVVSLNEFVESGNEPVMDAKGNFRFAQPEEVIAETELKRMLKDAMQLLTEKEQKVILLYYYEDLTLKEISRVLVGVGIKNFTAAYQGTAEDEEKNGTVYEYFDR